MFGYRHIRLAVAAVAALLMACSPRGLREAQSVVTQADSLWQAGQMYDDSLRLAEAYRTLDDWQWIYPDEFAHSGYHYGRLLRTRDNPVEAMQCFISATHSRTRDYHILGRVYSNIGSICHLASEFPLSYDMYKRSADYFLKNGDTINYYYALNDMAYELAEEGKKEKVFLLLRQVEKSCRDVNVLTKILETKAEACLYAHQYDSAVHYSTLLYSHGCTESAGLLIRAQAYSFMDINDSAIFYANRVLAGSNELYARNNALYILTKNDKKKDSKVILETASNRADVQKLIENKRSYCAQAAQLLIQDLSRTPDWGWFYAVIVTIVIIGTCAMIYIHRKRAKHQLLTQQVNDLTQINTAAKQQHELIVREHTDYAKSIVNDIEDKCETIIQNETFPQNISWKDFPLMCMVIDENFYMFISKLRHRHTLNETEIRLCVLVLLHLDRNEISDVLPYAKNGVGKLKYRVAKKLETDTHNLRKYLISMIINESFKGSQ